MKDHEKTEPELEVKIRGQTRFISSAKKVKTGKKRRKFDNAYWPQSQAEEDHFQTAKRNIRHCKDCM